MNQLDVDTELGRLRVHVHQAEGTHGYGPGGGSSATGNAPVILWHSMFVDSRSWTRLLPRLGSRPLYVVDAPSSGDSEALAHPSDIDGCARAAVDVCRAALAATDATAVDWLGTAWGGHVGIALAAARPDLVRSLVAISAPTFPVPPPVRRRVRLLLPLYRVLGPRGPVRDAIVETLFTDDTRARDPEAIALLETSLRRSGRAMVPAVRTAILARTDLLPAARRIACPTLFVATDDRGEWTRSEAATAAAELEDGRVASIANARVIPALEQPEATAAVVTSFWADVDRRSTRCR